MPKYHISPTTGNPNLCKARTLCPFGGESSHFDSKEAARTAYEAKMENESRENQAFAASGKKRPKKEPPRGSYNYPCPNMRCKTFSHDLRDPSIVQRCLDKAVEAEPARKEEILAHHAQWLKHCMAKGAFAQEVNLAQQNIEAYLAKRGNLAPTLVSASAKAKAMLSEMARNQTNPSWVRAKSPAEELIFNYSKDYDDMKAGRRRGTWHSGTFATDQPMFKNTVPVIPARAAQPSVRTSPPASTPTIPVRPGPVTPAEMDLKTIHRELARAKAEAEVSYEEVKVPATKGLKKVFGRKETETIKRVIPNKRQVELENYIANLPPKTKQIAFLYEAVADREHNGEALARIEKEFDQMRKSEEQAIKEDGEALLTSSVDSMLRRIQESSSLG